MIKTMRNTNFDSQSKKLEYQVHRSVIIAKVFTKCYSVQNKYRFYLCLFEQVQSCSSGLAGPSG